MLLLLLSLAPALAGPCTVAGDGVAIGEISVPGGPAFGATGTVPEAEVTFDADDRAAAVLSGDGITLRVELVATDLEVHPRKAVRLAPWLVATDRATFVPGSARGGRLSVALTVDQLDGIGIVREEDVHDDVPCGALALTPPTWDQPEHRGGSLVQVTPPDGRAALHDDGGKAVAELETGLVGAVLDTEGEQARIRVETWGFEATGWVDLADTTPYDPGAGGFGIAGNSAACGLTYAEPRTCDVALPLLVRTGGTVVEVGELAAGRPFVALQDDGKYVPIVLPDTWLVVYDGFESARDGAELLVPFEACQRR